MATPRAGGRRSPRLAFWSPHRERTPASVRPRRRSGRHRSGNRSRARLSGVSLGFAGLLARFVDLDGQRSRRHLGGLLRVVCERHEVQVIGRDRTGTEHMVLQPIEQALPVGRAEQHDRKVLDLAGLGQRQRFEQLVQRAEAAWKDHEAACVFHEHVLAHEEVAKLDAEVDIFVQRLFVGKLDVATDRQPARLVASAVDRFHDPGTAAGDHRKTAVRQGRAELSARDVVRIVGVRPCGAENGDRGTDLVEGVKTFDELGQDARAPPGVSVVAELFDGAALQQHAVGRRLFGWDDQSTGAAAVSDSPASRLVHQASAGVSSRGSVSVGGSVGTATATGSVSLTASETRLRAFLAPLSSPFWATGSEIDGAAATSPAMGSVTAGASVVWSGISSTWSRWALSLVTSASSSWTRWRCRMCSVK